MDNQRGSDLLSDLPVDIIEKILMILPIRDAIKTSILSSKWRYRWVGLPRLVFDEVSMGLPEGEDDEVSMGLPEGEDEIDEDPLKIFVTRTLLRHQGPIHKFKLHATTGLDSCPNTDEWLLFLSRKDVKEFEIVIDDSWREVFCLPSRLYSCQNLTHLKLYGCRFSPPPPAFKGFMCLRTLTLSFVDVPSAEIESLVANSPLLERLECTYVGLYTLRISAPTLKYATLEGSYDEISLHAPLLAELSVTLDDADFIGVSRSVCNYTKFLGGFTNLDTLIGFEYFTKYLSIGIGQCHHPLSFHQLELITLHDVNFLDMNEILVVFRLIMDAPNLCYLEIKSCPDKEGASKTPHTQFWDSECPKNCTFKKLETVMMTGFTGACHELHFINFLLQSSPVLESLIIGLVKTMQQEMLDLINEWLFLCQGFTNAEIFLKNK